MGKSLHPIRNWSEYNRGLVERGSLTVWMDASAIASWHNVEHHGGRGRGYQYSDTAIETMLMLKAVFKLPLRALEGFVNSLFRLLKVDLVSPDYSSISKRAKTVIVNYRPPSRGRRGESGLGGRQRGAANAAQSAAAQGGASVGGWGL